VVRYGAGCGGAVCDGVDFELCHAVKRSPANTVRGMSGKQGRRATQALTRTVHTGRPVHIPLKMVTLGAAAAAWHQHRLNELVQEAPRELSLLSTSCCCPVLHRPRQTPTLPAAITRPLGRALWFWPLERRLESVRVQGQERRELLTALG
jgi:hypothetical protein